MVEADIIKIFKTHLDKHLNCQSIEVNGQVLVSRINGWLGHGGPEGMFLCCDTMAITLLQMMSSFYNDLNSGYGNKKEF